MKKTKKRILRNARRRALDVGCDFSITEYDFSIPEKCPILGLDLKFNTGYAKADSYSLDRIDPNKGYIPGNVVVISMEANRLKNKLDASTIRDLFYYYKEIDTCL